MEIKWMMIGFALIALAVALGKSCDKHYETQQLMIEKCPCMVEK